MKILKSGKSLLKRIQDLPESKRKIILWVFIVIIGLVLFVFYAKNVQKKLKSFEVEKFKKEIQLPFLKKQFENLPNIEIPRNLPE